ncbi:hypothetical protein I7I50_12454 [Histoplasma capsulatum G186AR]|uniref:Uncharacterized protein n=1 Tax=Ajellomyces capsulatus TaxID=5037 RepID=A0A8H7YCR8_AJECA|nr:hypothetical protein I7I52_11239 [Histoplasma capsulatum]QSS70727.1 hypothetical protein I7I50_12454 [Histoplasma capsulatum G186AR]
MPMMGALCGIYRSCVFPCVYSVYHSDAKSASCPASQPASPNKKRNFCLQRNAQKTDKHPPQQGRLLVASSMILPVLYDSRIAQYQNFSV